MLQEHAQLDSSRLSQINECFLSLGADSFENINRFVCLCGELLGGTCAVYNRLYRNTLFSLGQWQTPPDYVPEDRPEGRICYDVIKRGGNSSLIVRNLKDTPYFHSDPNVSRYGLETYFGRSVKCQNTNVGSLCVVFRKDYVPTQEDEELIGMIAKAIGIEEERLRVSEESVRDLLTGLYNRQNFNHRLDEEIDRADANGHTLAVLLCGLDRFKVINDTHGHQAGDDVLKSVAKSFQGSTRGNDLVFRWAGDEMAIVLRDTGQEGVINVCHRIRRGILEIAESTGFDLDVSIGVAMYPEHGADTEELMRIAGQALFIAKKSGDKINVGEEEYRLTENTIKVVFQPVVNTVDNQIIGYEALSRDASGKMSILELFKRYRAIGKVYDLKRVCYAAQLREAERVGISRLFVNVEFSLLPQLESIRKPDGIEVILEISEVEALHDIDDYLRAVDQWRRRGFKFAIDDFGAGFISLPFIGLAMPDYIKMDRQTVLNAVSSEKFRKFAASMVQALGHFAAEGIIAEGVEYPEELEVVREIGIDRVQGFLLGKPQPMEPQGGAS